MFRQFKHGSCLIKNIPENKADCYDHQVVLKVGLMNIQSVGWYVVLSTDKHTAVSEVTIIYIPIPCRLDTAWRATRR
jgi:hypothetical protein